MPARPPGFLAKALRDIRLCIGFYTVLPVGAPNDVEAADGSTSTAPDFGAESANLGAASSNFGVAQWAAPIAGAIVGCLAGGVFYLAQYGGLTSFVSATLALCASILLTGALHEDGLADLADGFGGGRTVERKLAIMKDSRIGTYGVLALIAGFTLRLTALAALGEHVGAAVVAIVLIGAHAASRALIPLFMRLLPPARTSGLAAGFGEVPNHTVLIALLLGAVALLMCGIWTAIAASAILIIWIAALRLLALAQINGMTGDVLGTLQQGSEIIILVVASALLAGQ